MPKAPEAMRVVPVEVMEVLSKAKCEGKSLTLQGQLDPKLYAEVDRFINLLGGKWNTGRQCHRFVMRDASLAVAEAMAGKVLDKKKKFQLFETPDEVAMQAVGLLALAGRDTILEPSAGNGALCAVLKRHGGEFISVCEVQPELRENLAKQGYEVIGDDFMKAEPRLFDRIVMNPPFANGQDVQHVKHAFDNFLKVGGILVAIMSTGWKTNRDKASVAFREFYELMENAGLGQDEDIDAGAFKKSGTNVATIMIRLDKPAEMPVPFVLSFDRDQPTSMAHSHQGWSNSATFLFNTYFMQERENYEAFCSLCKNSTEPTAQLLELAEKMFVGCKNIEPMDAWAEGAVNVWEIVKNHLESR